MDRRLVHLGIGLSGLGAAWALSLNAPPVPASFTAAGSAAHPAAAPDAHHGEADHGAVAHDEAGHGADHADPPERDPAHTADWRLQPPPTEHWLEEGAEKVNKKKRKAWFEVMRRGAPGVEWRVVERANGLAQTARRNAIAAGQLPPAPAPGAWVERGSENQAGRMHVARHAPDGETLYAGSSAGGVWRSRLGDWDWAPIGDNLYGGAHWLEVLTGDDPAGPPIVLASTDGGLVHRTLDDGASWTAPVGTDGLSSTRRTLLTTEGSEAAFLVAYDGQWRVFRSLDGAERFEPIYDLGGYAGDLWAPRDGGEGLYLAARDGIHFSDDLGDSWTHQGGFGRASSSAQLVGSEAGAPRLWAVLDSQGIYRSDDAGGSWSYIDDVADYWGTLNASITDVDVFAYAGVEMYITFDAGGRFDRPNYWWDYYYDPATLLHADFPGLDVALTADGDEIWYADTDGGLFRSVDGLRSFENLSLTGLRVSQYYDVLTSTLDPDHVAAGSQDQGYQVSNDIAQTDGVLEFDQIISGDYGHLTSGDGTHAFVYSTYPGFILIQVGEESPALYQANFPSGESYVPWIPPVIADPYDREAFFFPATRLYRYERFGWAWRPQVYSNDIGLSGGEYASAMVFSPLDPERAYLATSSGGFFYSDDHGLTWTKSQSLVADDNWYYGQAIVASNTDVDTVYVGGSGYGVPAVYKSTDGGVSFAPWGDGLPSTLVYCLAEAPDGSGALFAGTHNSAWRRDPGMSEWVDITGADAPLTTYWACETLQHENAVRFATYGRGIWDYQLDPDGTGCYPVQDYDGDGVDCESDCDDLDASVFPGAAEECDGFDQNCDETDLDEWDEDGDGFLACGTGGAGDCDDGDASVFPGAEEICGDGVDQDCDGADAECPEDTSPPVEESPPEEIEGAYRGGGGCGCSGAGGPAGALAAMMALLAIRRRRAC